jgi:hypothetical protein
MLAQCYHPEHLTNNGAMITARLLAPVLLRARLALSEKHEYFLDRLFIR